MPPKKQDNLRTRIRKLLEQMTAGVYERDHVLAMALLSAVADESIFLLGLPGVGKSLVARGFSKDRHPAAIPLQTYHSVDYNRQQFGVLCPQTNIQGVSSRRNEESQFGVFC